MTDDKSKNGNGGFFDEDDDLLEEHTVVDTEVLQKLNDKIQNEEEDADLIVEPELLEEIEVKPKSEPEYQVPPKAEDIPVPTEVGGKPVVAGSDLSEKEQDKLNKIHSMFEEPDDPSSSVVADEKTVILPDEEISGMSNKPSAKLLVLEGPEKGKEYKIEYNEIFIGRGVENDFVISDRSISRKHFRIRRRLDEYICVDLQSGNGTRINDEKVDEAVLKSGDVITAGKCSLKFVDDSQPEQAAAPVIAEPKVEESATEPAPVPELEPVPEAAPVPGTVPEAIKVNEPEPVSEPEPKLQEKSGERRLEPMSAQRSSDDLQKPASNNNLIIAIVVIIVVVVALMFFQQNQKDETAKVAEAPKPAVQQPTVKTETQAKPDVGSLMAKGDQQLAAKLFSDAAESFNAVLVIDAGNKDASAKRDKALVESANQKILEEGKKLAEENNVDSAVLRLKTIGTDSVFNAEAQALISSLELNRYNKDVEKGKSLLASKEYDQAISVFASVLEKQPGNIEAAKYRTIAEKEKEISASKKAEEKKAALLKLEQEKKELARKKEQERKALALKRAEEKRAEEARRKQLEAERRKAEAERKRKAEQDRISRAKEEKARKAELERQRRLAEEAKKRKVTSDADLNKGYSLYKTGKLDQSIAEFNTIVNGRGNTSVMKKAKRIVASIKKFEKVYAKGVKAHSAKNIKSALTNLKEALRQDLKIANGSTFKGKLATMIADMYYEVGKQAMKKDDYETAMKAYNRALKFDSGHALSKRALLDIKQQAQKLYYQGYAVKDSDPDKAEKLWETVLKIAPKSSQWYKKAQSGLDEL